MKSLFAAFLGHRFLAACLLGLAVVLPATATSVVPMYLDEIIDRSATAFEGVCIENRTGRDPTTNMVVTFTTFEVRDVLKGNVGTTHIIKQIGGTSAGEGLHFEVKGVPRFTVGESYVVFLAGVSSAGFSSPIGLGQGKFSIREEAAGKREVTNGRDFKDLASRMPNQASAMKQDAATDSPRHLDIDAFKQLVRGRAAPELRSLTGAEK